MSAITDNPAGDLAERQLPELLTEEERATMLRKAEWLWNALQQNNLGGFSGINRPFYILNAFKEVIEDYGHRDVGLRWSKNDLDAARALLSHEVRNERHPLRLPHHDRAG